MSEYSINDWWSTSPAENLKNQYVQLSNYLTYEIIRLHDLYSMVNSIMTQAYNGMPDTISNCQGKVPELLLQKIGESKQETINILTNLDVAIQALHAKQSIVNNRIKTLKWYCNDEDRREKEYTYGQIRL